MGLLYPSIYNNTGRAAGLLSKAYKQPATNPQTLFDVGGRATTSSSNQGAESVSASENDEFWSKLLNTFSATSQSQQGLPAWGESLLQTWLPGYLQNALSMQEGAYADLEKAPEYIEKKRQSLLAQYLADIQTPFQETISKAISRLGDKGVLSSSTAGKALGEAGAETERQFATAGREADQWAADALLSLLGTKLTGSSQIFQNLTGLLSQARYGTSSSINPTPAISLLGI